MRAHFPGEHGFSATEIVTVLATAGIVALTMKPVVGDYVASAKAVKADHDARAIALGFTRFAGDVRGAARSDSGLADYTILVSNGAIPQITEDGDARWVLPPVGRQGVHPAVGLLRDVLVDAQNGATPAGWRGPYLDDGVPSDPWDRRYAVNVHNFFRGGRDLTFVLSAGANGVIETAFDTTSVRPGGDDVIALVSAGGF